MSESDSEHDTWAATAPRRHSPSCPVNCMHPYCWSHGIIHTPSNGTGPVGPNPISEHAANMDALREKVRLKFEEMGRPTSVFVLPPEEVSTGNYPLTWGVVCCIILQLATLALIAVMMFR